VSSQPASYDSIQDDTELTHGGLLRTQLHNAWIKKKKNTSVTVAAMPQKALGGREL
jgi:hypothetical protein